jgi:hypothetical protein
MQSTILHATSTEGARHRRLEADRRRAHAAIVGRMAVASWHADERDAEQRARTREPVTGRCSACGSVEVTLTAVSLHTQADGTAMGWGCEVCD